MIKIKKSNIITAIICAIFISAASFYTGVTAATENSISYKSQGKIVFSNNTEDTADDVVFDASDFTTINDMVVSGKKLVGTELNKYPSVNMDLTTIPDFSELAMAVDTLTDDATADSNMILKDATAYVKGAKIKGAIPSKGEALYTPGRADQTIASGQYLNGTQTIKGDTNLTSANIVEGMTIFGVTGTAKIESHIVETNRSVSLSDISGTITPSSGNNAMEQVTYSISGVDADKIVSGQSILGVAGTVIEESHTALAASDIVEASGTALKVLESGKTYKIPSGKYTNGEVYLSAESINENIVKSYLEDPVHISNSNSATISVGIPSDDCIVVFAHPERPNNTLSELDVPTGANIIFSNVTPEIPSSAIRYYIVKVTGNKNKVLGFKFTNIGTNQLYVRYVVCDINISSASVVSADSTVNLTRDKYYIIVRNVDNRSWYHDFFSGAVVQYYDMPYASTYFMYYNMANISVIKALENSTIETKSTGNYDQHIVLLN
ncbi:MAG: hypothetical protein HDR19_01990 [Lachnospiraceae bacterium]|nr:hypothetical protein [Lachnospiraceae bacterium]